MKKLIMIILILISFLCVGCQQKVAYHVEMLYSGSIGSSPSLVEVVQIIETFEDYETSGYALDLEASFFDEQMLYTYQFIAGSTGQNLYKMDHFVFEHDRLTIFYEINQVLTIDVLSAYAMVFSVDKALYEKTNQVTVKNVYDFDDVNLIYSGDTSSYGVVTSAVEMIDSYRSYQTSNYELGLEASFFENYILYTYGFLNMNIGQDIFLYHDYDIFSNMLILNCYENEDIIVSPAFGGYVLVFAISKDIYEQVNNIKIDLFNQHTVDTSEYDNLLPLVNRIFYFDFEESYRLNMFFDSYDRDQLEGNISSHLYDLNTELEVDVDELDGSFGFFVVLDPGQYVLMIDVDDPFYETRYFVDYILTLLPNN